MEKKDVMDFLKDCRKIIAEFEKKEESQNQLIARLAYEIYNLRKQIKESK